MPFIPLSKDHFLKMKKDYYLRLVAGGFQLVLGVRKEAAPVTSERYGYSDGDDVHYNRYEVYFDGLSAVEDQTEEEKGAFTSKNMTFALSTLQLEVLEIDQSRTETEPKRIPSFIEYDGPSSAYQEVRFLPPTPTSFLPNLLESEDPPLRLLLLGVHETQPQSA